MPVIFIAPEVGQIVAGIIAVAVSIGFAISTLIGNTGVIDSQSAKLQSSTTAPASNDSVQSSNAEPFTPGTVTDASIQPEAQTVVATAQATDFTYVATGESSVTITGFTVQGAEKFSVSSNTSTSAPSQVTPIKDLAFPSAYRDSNGKTWTITGINITTSPTKWIRITRLPDSLTTMTSLGKTRPTKNGHVLPYRIEISRWPSSLSTISTSAFADTSFPVLPSSWSNVRVIGAYAFQSASVEQIPSSWGKIEAIGESAFASNALQSKPGGSYPRTPGGPTRDITRDYSIY